MFTPGTKVVWTSNTDKKCHGVVRTTLLTRPITLVEHKDRVLLIPTSKLTVEKS